MVQEPNRQSIRKKGWDYTAAGCYFVTCNTHENRPLFGTVVNGQMVLNVAGRIASEAWRKSAQIRDEIALDEFVIMPNHVHGVVRIAGATRGSPAPSGDLPVARTPLNPQNYHAVMNVAEPRCLGNRALLDLPKVGFLASHGAANPHGRLPLKAGEAVLSGFLSPMERTVFTAGLAHGTPLIWVKPWGLQDGADTPASRRALEDGRLLILSPFDDATEAPSARRAVWCNQYVLAHCNRMVVGHLDPDGMLACILSEAAPDLEVSRL